MAVKTGNAIAGAGLARLVDVSLMLIAKFLGDE